MADDEMTEEIMQLLMKIDETIKRPNYFYEILQAVFQPIFHRHSAVRKKCFDYLQKFRGFLLVKKTELAPHLVTIVVNENFLKDALYIQETLNKPSFVSKIMIFILEILGPALHAENVMAVISKMLSPMFASYEYSCDAFKTWAAMIKNFALDLDFMLKESTLEYIFQPLHIIICRPKLYTYLAETYWDLIVCCEKRLFSNFEKLVFPVLETLTSTSLDEGSPYPAIKDEEGKCLALKNAAELLLRLLDSNRDPVVINPDDKTKFKIPSKLQAPIDHSVLFCHFEKLMKATQVILRTFGNEIKMTETLERLSTAVLSILKHEKDQENQTSDFSKMTVLVNTVYNAVTYGIWSSRMSSKFLTECANLPLRYLTIEFYQCEEKKDEADSVAEMLAKLALQPNVLKSWDTDPVAIKQILLMSIQHSGSSSLQSILLFIRQIQEKRVIDSAMPHELRTIWLVITDLLLETIDKDGKLNEGDDTGRDFSAFISVFTYPIAYFLPPKISMEMFKGIEDRWNKLAARLIEKASSTSDVKNNTIFSTICTSLLDILNHKSGKFENAAYYYSVCTFLRIIAEHIYIDDGSEGFQEQIESVQLKEKLGSLTSFIDSLVVLLDKFRALLEMEDTETSAVSYLTKDMMEKFLSIFDLVQLFIHRVGNHHLIMPIMGLLSQPLAAIFKIRYMGEKVIASLATKLELFWKDVLQMIKQKYKGPYEEEFLEVLTPLIEATLCYPRKNIAEQTKTFWLATFALSMLQFSDGLKDALMRAKVPGRVISVNLNKPKPAVKPNQSVYISVQKATPQNECPKEAFVKIPQSTRVKQTMKAVPLKRLGSSHSFVPITCKDLSQTEVSNLLSDSLSFSSNSAKSNSQAAKPMGASNFSIVPKVNTVGVSSNTPAVMDYHPLLRKKVMYPPQHIVQPPSPPPRTRPAILRRSEVKKRPAPPAKGLVPQNSVPQAIPNLTSSPAPQMKKVLPAAQVLPPPLPNSIPNPAPPMKKPPPPKVLPQALPNLISKFVLPAKRAADVTKEAPQPNKKTYKLTESGLKNITPVAVASPKKPFSAYTLFSSASRNRGLRPILPKGSNDPTLSFIMLSSDTRKRKMSVQSSREDSNVVTPENEVPAKKKKNITEVSSKTVATENEMMPTKDITDVSPKTVAQDVEIPSAKTVGVKAVTLDSSLTTDASSIESPESPKVAAQEKDHEPKDEDLKSKNEDLKSKKEDDSQNGDLKSKNEDLKSKNEDYDSQNDDVLENRLISTEVSPTVTKESDSDRDSKMKQVCELENEEANIEETKPVNELAPTSVEEVLTSKVLDSEPRQRFPTPKKQVSSNVQRMKKRRNLKERNEKLAKKIDLDLSTKLVQSYTKSTKLVYKRIALKKIAKAKEFLKNTKKEQIVDYDLVFQNSQSPVPSEKTLQSQPDVAKESNSSTDVGAAIPEVENPNLSHLGSVTSSKSGLQLLNFPSGVPMDHNSCVSQDQSMQESINFEEQQQKVTATSEVKINSNSSSTTIKEYTGENLQAFLKELATVVVQHKLKACSFVTKQTSESPAFSETSSHVSQPQVKEAGPSVDVGAAVPKLENQNLSHLLSVTSSDSGLQLLNSLCGILMDNDSCASRDQVIQDSIKFKEQEQMMTAASEAKIGSSSSTTEERTIKLVVEICFDESSNTVAPQHKDKSSPVKIDVESLPLSVQKTEPPNVEDDQKKHATDMIDISKWYKEEHSLDYDLDTKQALLARISEACQLKDPDRKSSQKLGYDSDQQIRNFISFLAVVAAACKYNSMVMQVYLCDFCRVIRILFPDAYTEVSRYF